jgi:hypothetical protein
MFYAKTSSRTVQTLIYLVFHVLHLTLSSDVMADADYASAAADASLQSALDWYLSNLPHRRDKRFLWLTHEKRIVLPPGTQMVLTPTLAMPLLRYPPPGLDSNLTISTPFTSKYNDPLWTLFFPKAYLR